MKKTTILTGVLIALILLFAAACGEDEATKSPIVTLTNETGATLVSIKASYGEDVELEDGKEILGGKKIKAGETFEIQKSLFENDGSYDFLFTDAQGKSYVLMMVYIKGKDALSITKEQLMDF